MMTKFTLRAAGFQQGDSANNGATAHKRPTLISRIKSDLKQAWALYVRQFEGPRRMPPMY